MKYDFRTGHGELTPCCFVDAEGREIFHVVQCDTETGWVQRHVLDDAGLVQINHAGPVIEERYYPAPLTLKRLALVSDGRYMAPCSAM